MNRDTHTFLCFFSLGLFNNILYVIILSAAVDLVHSAPKSIVLLADILPSFTFKLTSPFFIHRLSYPIRVFSIVSLSFSGLVLISLTNSLYLTIFGICLASLSSGLGEVTWLQLTHHFPSPHTQISPSLSAFSSGTGAAGLFGSFYYLLLTVILSISPWKVLLLSSFIPFGILISFYSLNKGSMVDIGFSGQGFERLLTGDDTLAQLEEGVTVGSNLDETSRTALSGGLNQFDSKGVYGVDLDSNSKWGSEVPGSMKSADILKSPFADSPVGDTSHSYNQRASRSQTASTDGTGQYSGHDNTRNLSNPRQVDSFDISDSSESIIQSNLKINDFKLTIKRLTPLIVPYMIPLTTVYIGEYIINQGISPTLLFPLDQVGGVFKNYKDQYVVYGFLYQAGVFISRSSINYVRIRKLYLLSGLQFLNVGILIIQSMNNWPFSSIWWLMILIFYEGLLGGFSYVNTFMSVSEESEEENREFAMGAVSISDSLGIVIAGCISLRLEPFLCSHQVKNGQDWCLGGI